MHIQNQVKYPKASETVEYLSNAGLEMFYIAPKQRASAAAKNTSPQLTDTELQDFKSGRGRVGIHLDTPNYTMLEISYDDDDTKGLTSVALLPDPVLKRWNTELQGFSSLYWIDAPLPDMRIGTPDGDMWITAKGSFNDPSAHFLLLGGTAKSEDLVLYPPIQIDNPCVATKDLEWRLRCAAVSEWYSRLIKYGTDASYLMQYLAVNGIEFSNAIKMINASLRFESRHLSEWDVRPIYLNIQQSMTKKVAYDSLHNRFQSAKVADALDNLLGFTAPES